ncbi:MAG: NAD(P)H-hydrate dehydratase [Ignavibacteria bacterium]|nr:NAD(P)H-hydrate dehydratase [Ignavibacteria bacterium]
MKNVFFNSEISCVEKIIIPSLKVPSLILMENAGRSFTEILLQEFPDIQEHQIIIFTGKGNNAGDGFVIARHLCNLKLNVRLVMISSRKDLSGEAGINFDILKNSEIISKHLSIINYKNISDLKDKISFDNSIIIDAIFGVGFKGEPDKKTAELINFINGIENKKVIAVDVPSGLSNYDQKSKAVKADITVSMSVKKFDTLFYSGREFSGKILTADIGISGNEFTYYNINRIFETEESDVRKYIPVRKINSNKYTNGKTLVIAGSKGLTGAAYLSSVAAMRAGSGAVITAVPESVNDILEIKMTEVMTLPQNETDECTLNMNAYEKISKKIKWADCVLIGPGLSKNEETMELVRHIVKNNQTNYVIDADALNAFKDNLNILKNKNIILTPHFGEFASLTGMDLTELKSNFYNTGKDFAKRYNVTLILKNSPTVITDGKDFIINPTGKENLATAGSGDVLSGITAGLYSVTGNAMESSVAAVYIHGMCGDRLYEKSGSSSTLAGDLICEIGFVKNKFSAS